MGNAGGTPQACAGGSQSPRPGATTVTTIGQAYGCILAHYYGGRVLDDRVLLAGAFAGLTQQLDRLGVDQPNATMPALTGSRAGNWDAFANVYRQVVGNLPASKSLRQAVAAATMTGMVAALHDDHARWLYSNSPPASKPDDTYGLGLNTSPALPLAASAPAEAVPPLFVTSVAPGSPAARYHVRPGSIIAAVNGAPPFTDGIVSPGVISLLRQQYPQQSAVRITLQSPVTGQRRTISLRPAVYKVTIRAVTSKLLDGHVAYVKLPLFFGGAASQVLDAVSRLRQHARLRGVIFDLRGNGGGLPGQVARLLGAFEHGRPWSYDCTGSGKCTANYPDTTPLLHLRLVVLTDRSCASGGDAFSDAVKDLRLGTLLGTRTAGIVAGVAVPWSLNDGSVLWLPTTHELGAAREQIDGIGVAPDYYLPLTAKDVGTGHDPDIAEALAVLGRTGG